MSNNNDSIIISLKEQIETKKRALKSAGRFSPVTNCSLELNGQRVNINVVGKEQLLQLLVTLKSYQMAAESLKLEDVKFSGFALNDWITDLQARYSILDKKQEEERLKFLEDRLHTLLSTDKKVELEIEALKKQI